MLIIISKINKNNNQSKQKVPKKNQIIKNKFNNNKFSNSK